MNGLPVKPITVSDHAMRTQKTITEMVVNKIYMAPTCSRAWPCAFDVR